MKIFMAFDNYSYSTMRWDSQIAQLTRVYDHDTPVLCSRRNYNTFPSFNLSLPKLLVPSSSKENPNFSQCLFFASLCDKLFFMVIPLFKLPLSKRFG